MKKVVVFLTLIILIGVLALEAVTLIKMVKANQYLPNIEYIP